MALDYDAFLTAPAVRKAQSYDARDIIYALGVGPAIRGTATGRR